MGYSENMSPDSTSSLFPDRPIRPLPKRTIRQRLSPEVAKTIKYPPTPQNIPPLFAYPYNGKEDSGLLGSEPSTAVNRENVAQLGQEAALRRNDLGGGHHEESIMGQARRALISRPFQDSEGGTFRTPQRIPQARHGAIQPPPSTTSSADGYDSFENANNKKKRKIPTAGETILNSTHVLNDSSALGMPSPPTTGDEGPGDLSTAVPAPYYQSGGPSASTQGISGPGRGRYGRVRNGRSPLRALPEPNGAWNGRTPKLRGPDQYPPPGGENSGIISNAIATAGKLPVLQGQENISLLQQQTSAKNRPTSSTQFTFTFDSQNPVSWPGSDPAPSRIPGSSYLQHHPTSSSYRDVHNNINSRAVPVSTGAIPSTRPAATQTGTNMASDVDGSKRPATPNAAPKRPKPPVKSLKRVVRERRQQAQYANYLHPPTPEEYWLCEICEYERLFGHPPITILRQFEIKNRKKGQEDANRKRLLDRAKAKSRKGKKSKAGKSGNSSTVRPNLPPADEHDHMYLNDEEYYHDDLPSSKPEYYDDEPGDVYKADVEWFPPHPTSVSPTLDQPRGPGAGEGQAHAIAST